MRVSVTLLSDNVVNTEGLLAEHGLCVLLETDGQQVLFDVGQSVSARHNAEALGIALRSPPIILSHGHYDHTGGLRYFVREFSNPTIFAHPDIFRQRFSATTANYKRNIGAAFTKEELESEGAKIYLHAGPREVLNGVWITGQIPRLLADDQAIAGLSLDAAGKAVDDVRDEIGVVIEGSKKAVVLLGCAHAGVRNTINYIETLTDTPLCGLVGGLHLMSTPKHDVQALAAFLRERGVEFVGASHCTGCQAADVLSRYVKCTMTAVGTRLHFYL